MTEHTQSSRANHAWLKYLGLLAVIISVVIAILSSSAWWLYSTYAQRISPNISIGGIAVGGMTYAEATQRVQAAVDGFLEDGIQTEYISFDGISPITNTLTLLPETVPLSASETTQTFYSVDVAATIQAAYALDRNTSVLNRLYALATRLLLPTTLPVASHIDSAAIIEVLRGTYAQFETAPVDATIEIDEQNVMRIIPDQSGVTFVYEDIVDTIEQRVNALSSESIQIIQQETVARTLGSDLERQRLTIETYLTRAPITITFENNNYTFDIRALSSWLQADAHGVSVNPDRVNDSFDEIHKNVDTAASDGRWELEKDAAGVPIGIHEITPSQHGRVVDVVATARAINEYLADTTATTVTLATAETLPAFAAANTEGLQIRDILGTGHSNMAGSPANRRKNIARGVELLNGLLIPPGEKLSLVQAIKPFELSNGYVPELVIKGNKTEPEIGGGLCQVGTTLFRGAMESGLPIISRSNHAYAVSYYTDDRNNKPGTDATIYDPAPDFVFQNDTPGYILLQTRIEGNDLYFDFWGTSDGRDGSFSAPITYDYVSPPPMKEIPTTTLAPGQRKCTESAHAGLTAEFTYSIKKADGSQIDRVFVSKYRPWQAVCLVGQSTETPTETVTE